MESQLKILCLDTLATIGPLIRKIENLADFNDTLFSYNRNLIATVKLLKCAAKANFDGMLGETVREIDACLYHLKVALDESVLMFDDLDKYRPPLKQSSSIEVSAVIEGRDNQISSDKLKNLVRACTSSENLVRIKKASAAYEEALQIVKDKVSTQFPSDVPKELTSAAGEFFITDHWSHDYGDEAKSFWESSFGKAVFVHRDKFCDAICRVCKIRTNADHIEDLFDVSQDGWISAKEFDDVLWYFGPFRKLGERLQAALALPNFFGYKSNESVNDIFTQNSPQGHRQTYWEVMDDYCLLRMSSNTLGTFRLHYVTPKVGQPAMRHFSCSLGLNGYQSVVNGKLEHFDTIKAWVDARIKDRRRYRLKPLIVSREIGLTKEPVHTVD